MYTLIELLTSLGFLLQEEHRPLTTLGHGTWLWADFSMFLHEGPLTCISATTSLYHLFLGLSLFFPCRFQACLVMLQAGFLRVQLVQLRFLLLISVTTGSWFALLHRSSLVIFSGQWIQRTVLHRQLLRNVWSWWNIAFQTTEENYFTVVLNIHSLVGFVICS